VNHSLGVIPKPGGVQPGEGSCADNPDAPLHARSFAPPEERLRSGWRRTRGWARFEL